MADSQFNPNDRVHRIENDSSEGSTSRSLIDRLKNNEAPAWRDLVQLYSPLIFHWCRRAGLPDQECPDTVQEVFRSVVAGIGQFRKRTEADTFRGWLRTIARNKVHDYFRRHGKQPAAVGGSEAHLRLAGAADVDDDLAGDEQDLQAEHELYRRAFDMIRRDFKPQTWNAFWQVVVEGKDALQVAQELNMRPGTIRVAKSRVLRRLREQLGELLD